MNTPLPYQEQVNLSQKGSRYTAFRMTLSWVRPKGLADSGVFAGNGRKSWLSFGHGVGFSMLVRILWFLKFKIYSLFAGQGVLQPGQLAKKLPNKAFT